MPITRLNRLKRPPFDSWPKETEIVFEHGLFGFEQYKRYLLTGHKDEVPLLRLEAIDNREISFFVIDPFLASPDYEPTLTHIDLKDVGVIHEAKLILLAIVDTKERPFTMNLGAPLLIHWMKKKGKQILTHGDLEYPITPHL